jgi:hypothetical protein
MHVEPRGGNERRRTPGRPARTNGPMTFIVRIAVEEGGGVVGVVERVRTGQKEQVHSVDEIGRVIASMIAERKAGP